MNKEEYIDNILLENNRLYKENKELKRNCNIGNENLSFYIQENNQLKEQRQELRSWLEEETKKGGSSIDLAIRIHTIQEVLNKLNELEGGKNE